MISMKSKTNLKVDFGWFGPIPDSNRVPGESAGHLTFFVECMQCDKKYEKHLLNCEDMEELVQLFQMYNKRLEYVLPFKMLIEDFEILAANTWKDPEYQKMRKNAS